MDAFSACVAFGPLAIYLVFLGAINLSRRPLLVRGSRETLALGLALAGLAVIGPMQLFMPQEAATRFGQWVWILLVSFYLLCLMLAILLGRPRLIAYNIEPEALRQALDETARRLDPETTWAGKALTMPRSRVHLQIQSFSPLANVSLAAVGDDQSIGGWQRLEAALRSKLADVPAAARPRGAWLLVWGLGMLAVLGYFVADDPQMIARGVDRLFQP
jgi:hypothetical protein